MQKYFSAGALGPWLLFILVSSIMQELVLAIFMEGTSLWTLIFVLIINLFILGLLLLVKKSIRKHLLDFYLILNATIYITEFLYFRHFRTFFSFRMLSMAGQLGQFTLVGLKLIAVNLPVLFIFALPALVYFKYLRSYLDRLKFKSSTALILVYVTIFVFSMNHIVLSLLPNRPASAHEYYFYTSPQLERVKKFGLLSALNIEASHGIFGARVPEIKVEEDLGEALLEIERGQAGIGESPSQGYTIAPQVLDIDFLGLSKTRDSETLASMDRFFASTYPSMTNEYTGLFKGYNLIFITAESFWRPVVDPVRTPTLYKMVHEGIYMKNFYNPLWTASTSDGEYSGISGMLPRAGSWSLLESSRNYSPQLPGWRLQKEGYRTYAYHNHDYSYYERHISHPGIGYDYKGLGSGLEVTPQWPESDLEMMELSVDDYLDKEPFHVYYLSVSGHSGYSFSGNSMAYKNREVVEDLDLSEEAASYLAANMELEYAMSYLLEKLEEKGLAERTIIVLNPDHYPYALSDSALEELGGPWDSLLELYRSHGIIYVKGMEPMEVSKPLCGQDLLPTIYNLLGIDFDSRLLMGRDIFSSEGLVRFYDRSWITDKGYYDSQKDVFTPRKNVPEDYEEMIHSRVRNDFYFSSLMLEEDYYSHLPREVFE